MTQVPRALLAKGEHLRTALGAPDIRNLLILQAPTADGVLALSERIASRLAALQAQGVMDGVDLPSRYLPSLQTQRDRQAHLPDRATLEIALAEAQRSSIPP